MKPVRALALTGALVGAVGLALQYWLIVTDMTANGASVFEATSRYFAYFTILTNTLVTLVFARSAWRFDARGLNAPRVELMTVTSIMFVCIVYNLLLAPRWDPQGLQKLADVTVHQIVPALFLLYWFVRPHGGLRWIDAAYAAVWPAAYAAYGLTRGALDGFYPYFFMDPSALTIPQLLLNLAGLFASFVVGALILIAASRALGARLRPA